MKKLLFTLVLLLLISLVVVRSQRSLLRPPSSTKGGEPTFPHRLLPVVSNQWYSSVYKKTLPTSPLFTWPLAYQLENRGIVFSYPHKKATKDTVFAPFTEDFTLSLAGEALSKVEVTSLGDWDIGLVVQSNFGKQMSFRLTQGVPYTTVHAANLSLHLSIPNGFIVRSKDGEEMGKGKMTVSNFSVETRGSSYLFSLSKTTEITITEKEILLSPQSQVFVALLPNREAYGEFLTIADSEIKNTYADFQINGQSLETTYHFVTGGAVPLVALLPHQFDQLSATLPVIGTYDSLRGPLRLVRAKIFTTKLPKIAPKESFAPLTAAGQLVVKPALQQDLASLRKTPLPESKNYFLGTWLGKVASLAQLADSLDMIKEREELLDLLEGRLVDGFKYYTYDSSQTSFISTKPEFGNEKLNDHHFHYGYFIRAAAVLSRYRPQSMALLKPQIEEMVKDIATLDRQSGKYPFLRHFNAYESHSFADGYGQLADGLNQESSSEAMNAWYGLYLWARITNEKPLEDYSLYLFNQELLGAKYYWFNIANVYPPEYEHKIASIVWGGKVDFATWFAKEAEMVYGIELLPLTPASDYLGTLPDFSPYEKDFERSGGKLENSWGDLFLVWKSFYQPVEAKAELSRLKSYDGSGSKALTLYFIYRNQVNR